MKMPEPAVLPHFKPADYVDILAQIHEELEYCPPDDKSCLYLLQFQVFRGLGETKLSRRSLQAAWEKASTIHEKLIFGAWLKYEKRGEQPISDLLGSCGKCSQEFKLLDFVSQISAESHGMISYDDESDEFQGSSVVHLRIRDDMIACDRRKLAALSTPLYAMLNGGFRESYLEVIDMSRNGISPIGMRAISKFSLSGRLPYLSAEAILEMLDFANKFCCKGLKDACERKLASFVSSRQDAIDFMECAIELGCSILAASCLQVLLNELPECLNDEQVVRIFSSANKQQRSTMAGNASFSLYCLLSEVSMSISATSDVTISFLEKLVDSASDSRQKQLSLHQLACMRLLRKDHTEAERLFNAAFTAGHLYSVVGLARLASLRSNRHFSLKLLDSVMSSRWPLGWMYQERALYLDGDSKLENLNKATELDPTLIYPYMVRAASLMKRQSVEAALMEINRILGFKLVLECLELRFCCYLALEDYRAALCDVQAILTLAPDYRMIGGRVAAKQLRMLVMENVEQWTTADCWMQLYDRWSSVDDIGSLSVIYQMLESDAAKGVLYFRQSLLLLR
jgi:tetratricopeptide (TPR) repeat protein